MGHDLSKIGPKRIPAVCGGFAPYELPRTVWLYIQALRFDGASVPVPEIDYQCLAIRATGTGQAGVKHALNLLQAELVRIMQLAGTVSIEKINKAFVKKKDGNW